MRAGRRRVLGKRIVRSLRRAVIALAFVCLLSLTAALAQTSLSNQAMRSVGDDPRGLPVEVFVQKPLPLLAREMLLQDHLDEHNNTPRPQRKGVQVEVFAPGDFGVVVRYRW